MRAPELRPNRYVARRPRSRCVIAVQPALTVRESHIAQTTRHTPRLVRAQSTIWAPPVRPVRERSLLEEPASVR